MAKNKENKRGVINDPLGQTQDSSEHCLLLFCFSRFEKLGRTDGRTTWAKTIIPNSRDFGLAEWIDFTQNMYCLQVLKYYIDQFTYTHMKVALYVAKFMWTKLLIYIIFKKIPPIKSSPGNIWRTRLVNSMTHQT